MTEYVNGLLFSPDRRHLAMVHKKKPAWQAGRLNAIGGKKKPGETYHDAVVREFEEETGVHIPEWEHTITLTAPWGVSGPAGQDWWELRFFRAFSPEVFNVRTKETEEILVVPINLVGHVGQLPPQLNVIPNLTWAIPMSLDDHLGFPLSFREK